VPAISHGCESFSSYYKLRKTDDLFLKIGNINRIDLREKVHLLENHSRKVLFYDEESMNESFIESLFSDVLPLIENKDKAITTLNSLRRGRREHVLKAFEWLPKDAREKLSEYLDLLYYFQGGTFNNLNLAIHPSYLPSVKTKLLNSLPRTKLPAEYDCFREAINVLNLSQDVLLSLDPEKLIDLRRDPIVKRFLETLEKIYETTRRSLKVHISEFSDFHELRRQVNEAVKSELSSEIKSYKKYKRTTKILKGFAYITGFLSLFGLGPLLGSASALTIVGTGYELIDPFLNEIWKRIGNCEMIFFTQVLLDASYQPKCPPTPETPKSFLKKCVRCGKQIPIASEQCPYCGVHQPEYVKR